MKRCAEQNRQGALEKRLARLDRSQNVGEDISKIFAKMFVSRRFMYSAYGVQMHGKQSSKSANLCTELTA